MFQQGIDIDFFFTNQIRTTISIRIIILLSEKTRFSWSCGILELFENYNLSDFFLKRKRHLRHQHILKLKKGAKVELTWNMNTEIGLSHHTEGILVDVLQKDGADDILLVEFPS